MNNFNLELIKTISEMKNSFYNLTSTINTKQKQHAKIIHELELIKEKAKKINIIKN